MRLSDVMSSLHLAIYPIIAMALFLSVFIGVVVKVTNRARRSEFDEASLLPFTNEASHHAHHATGPAAEEYRA